MLKLYELPAAFMHLERAIADADGEITPEVEAELAGLEGNLEAKVDAIAALIREAEAESIAVKVEMDRLALRRQAADRRSARLKAYLHACLEEMGRDRVKGERFAVAIRRNSAPSIRWTGDVAELPDRFRRVSVELDGTAAREAWKSGGLPAGFEVVTGSHLRIS